MVLLRYAAEACGGLDGIALTCLDEVGGRVPLCQGYAAEGADLPGLERDRQGRITEIRPQRPVDLGHQERLGVFLRRVRPLMTDLTQAGLGAAVEEALGAPVVLESRGPAATDKRWRSGSSGDPADALLNRVGAQLAGAELPATFPRRP